MLLFGSRLKNTPVMSLQTGQELARTARPIIDPHILSIIAYEVEGPLLDVVPSLLRIADIREMSDIGMIIDSSEEFVGVDDIIKLKEIRDLNFHLVDILVYDTKGRKLGRVVDYSIEISSFVIEQLVVKRPLIRSLSDNELLIHRSQIKEITDDRITVDTGEVKAQPIHQAARNYINPFRANPPQPEPGQSGS